MLIVAHHKGTLKFAMIAYTSDVVKTRCIASRPGSGINTNLCALASLRDKDMGNESPKAAKKMEVIKNKKPRTSEGAGLLKANTSD